MKNTRFVKSILGLGSILALTVGLGSSAFAGPGAQYWQQMEKIRAENAAKAKMAAGTDAAKPAGPAAMACPACKTTAVTEYRPGGAGGKVPARIEQVGTKHACGACGGAITVIRGKTTNDMKANCPICAKAAPSCCAVKT